MHSLCPVSIILPVHQYQNDMFRVSFLPGHFVALLSLQRVLMRYRSNRLLLDNPRTEFAGPRSEVQGLYSNIDAPKAFPGANKAEDYDDSAPYAASEKPWKVATTKTFSKSADDAPATNLAANRDLSLKPVCSDFHTCGIRHELCRPPKNLKPDELKHYCGF